MGLKQLRLTLEADRASEAWVAAVEKYFDANELFFGHGTDNPADEAYWLVSSLQGWDPSSWTRAPEADLVDRLVSLAYERVSERKPLAYVLGEAWFAGLRFDVDERVLIPRSPLAELIERGFEPWCRLEPGDRVLDVGAGSGCIAIAVAAHEPNAVVDATEVSSGALEVARRNIARHGVGERVNLIEADLFPPNVDAYRVIVSNPPYVPSANLAGLPAEYGHEPAEALDGGPTGLDVVDRILAGAAALLVPGGVLIMEVGEARPAFEDAYPQLPVTWIEFERGGEGVLLLTREELAGYLAG